MTSAAIAKLRATLAEFERWRQRQASPSFRGIRLSEPNWERMLAEMAAVIEEAEREKAAAVEQYVETYRRGAESMRKCVMNMLQGRLRTQISRARGKGSTDGERLSLLRRTVAEALGSVIEGLIEQLRLTRVFVPQMPKSTTPPQMQAATTPIEMASKPSEGND